jgi:hypothetical protein
MTPTLSLHNGSSLHLHHVTQISPLSFLDSSPSPSRERFLNNKDRGLLLLSELAVPLAIPDALQEEQEEQPHTPAVPSVPLSAVTSEAPKKLKKRPLQTISIASEAPGQVEPPLKKQEIHVPLGPTPTVVRIVPSDAVMVSHSTAIVRSLTFPSPRLGPTPPSPSLWPSKTCCCSRSPRSVCLSPLLAPPLTGP